MMGLINHMINTLGWKICEQYQLAILTHSLCKATAERGNKLVSGRQI